MGIDRGSLATVQPNYVQKNNQVSFQEKEQQVSQDSLRQLTLGRLFKRQVNNTADKKRKHGKKFLAE
ncbi:MAG: hypothetical protein MZU97_10865 [Bacillus subtilis]|nr:hypothetical protein [Bacillus subtilis]